jgi:hypothetical protein
VAIVIRKNVVLASLIGRTAILDNDMQIGHRASHSGLVRYPQRRALAPDKLLTLNAIVVPAARPAHNLEHAITLARAARCQLVILCSKNTLATEVIDLLAARSFTSAIVIEVPSGYQHEFFDFETTNWIKQVFPHRKSDLSIKRNVGLTLARMLGWQKIFFMDDDIRDLDVTALHSTVSMISDEWPDHCYHRAGMPSIDFPDNSVVCHARRQTGRFQDVFVSGSALAVNCAVPFTFFPDIYNEDWLFFYHDAANGRLGASGHRATQLRYDPFAYPQRAANQEFGDVIAEGLYALLEQKLSADHATAARWAQFLADRKQMLDEIIDRSPDAPKAIREKMIYAVEVAKKSLAQIQPQMCMDYIMRWDQDLDLWSRKLQIIPQVASASQALRILGLPAMIGAHDSQEPNRLRSIGWRCSCDPPE